MKKIILALSFIISSNMISQTNKPNRTNNLNLNTNVSTLSKKEQDKTAIKSMAGIYKVNFDFAETFATDTAYKYHKRYSEWGIEYVFVVEESENKIGLQHLLILNDTIIIKHWRQDWVFENTEVYRYYKDNEWIKQNISEAQIKGTWTQKVYQVDDSPRYESFGTWVHIDSKHFWEGVNDSPLPRREFTKRNDYNVMRRHSRIEILPDGWVLNQDNEKIVRNNGIDKTICWEKGIEKFSKGNYIAEPAKKWWANQTNYWADVRATWDKIYNNYDILKIEKKVNNKMLYETLFEIGDKHCKDKSYNKGEANTEIKNTIISYIKA